MLARQIKLENQTGDGLNNAVNDTQEYTGLQLERCRLKLSSASECPRGDHEHVEEETTHADAYKERPHGCVL